MDTNGATPAATPVAASPAATSTPASSTPTSTPVTSTPAASHSPVQDGTRGAGALTHEASIDAMLAAVQNKQPGEPSTPVVTTDTGEVAEPAHAAEGGDTPEAGAGTNAEPEVEEYSFEEDGFVGARELAEKIDSNAALAAALPADVRDEIMANARIAEALAPYREVFGSPEEARIVAQTAQSFAEVQQIFGSIRGEGVQQGTSKLISKMLEMSALRDENGELRRRENGTYITDGTTTNFLNELFDRALNTRIVKKIQDSGDDAAIAALDLVMERAGMRPSTADKDQSGDPQLAARKAELDRQQAEITSQQQAAQQERTRQYTDSLNQAVQGTTDGAIEKLLGPATGLNDFTRTAVVGKLTRAIKDAVRKNTAYLMEKDQLELRPMGKARHDAEVALANRFLKEHLVRIARPILAEAGITITKKAGEKAAAQSARAEAARGEVQGGAPAQSKPANSANPAQAWSDTREKLKAQLGREPTQSEVNVEMMLNLPALKGRGRAA